MTDPTLIHHTFVAERRYPAAVATVWAAWADPDRKRRWFTGDRGAYALDFRVGGLETIRTRGDDDQELVFEARYVDVVEPHRIVFVSTLTADGVLATTSITSVELRGEGTGTALVLTESDVFLDGHEQPAWREQGTGSWLDALGRDLASTSS